MPGLPAHKKREAVKRVILDKEKVAVIAKEYGVARKTLYSWIERYKKDRRKGIDTLKPRYAKGRKHPKAKYPEIERKLLKLVAKNPDLTIEELAKEVSVSSWTVWNFLDKKNLNTAQQREKSAAEILKDITRLSAKRKREAVFKIIHENEKVAHIAEEYGVARKTLYSWIKRYEKERNDSLTTFKPRYVKGRDHPLAKYPDLQELILTIVANNPQLSIKEISKKVPASVWTVWNLLDKFNLNHKNQRMAFASELVQRREVRAKAYSLDTSFAYVAHQIELLMSQTRKIPKVRTFDLFRNLHILVLSLLKTLTNSVSGALQNITSAVVTAPELPRINILRLYEAADSITTDYFKFNIAISNYFKLVITNRITFLLSIPFIPSAIVDSLALRLEKAAYLVRQMIVSAANELHAFNFSLINYFIFNFTYQKKLIVFISSHPSILVDRLAVMLEKATYSVGRAISASFQGLAGFGLGRWVLERSGRVRRIISGSVLIRVPIPGSQLATRFKLILKANKQFDFVYSRLDYAADEMQFFILRLSSYFKTSPRYAFYFSGLVILFFIISGVKTKTQIGVSQQPNLSERIKTDIEQELAFKVENGQIALAGNNSFRITEDPQFIIQKQVSAFDRAGGNVSRVLGVRDSTEEEKPSVSVKNAEGKEIGGVSIEANAVGEYYVSVKRSGNLKPGKYAVNVTEPSGTSISKDFTWGLLVLNTDKKVYQQGDKVNFAMTVLDIDGKPVCDADLSLSITKASEEPTILTTENAIERNKECSPNKKTIYPDYELSSVVEKTGEYQIVLQAKVEDQNYSIASSFEVVKDTSTEDFVVSRGAPIRTAPGEDYPVIINIKANRDYQGKVVEKLPKSFLALPYTGNGLNEDQPHNEFTYTNFATKNSEDHQELVWDVDFKQGQTYKLKYAFSDLGTDWTDYALGPLTINSEETGARWELIKDLEVPQGNYVERMQFGSLRAEDRLLQLSRGQLRISMRKAHFESDESPVIDLEVLEGTNMEVATSSGLLQRILGVSREELDTSEQNKNLNVQVVNTYNQLEYESEISIDTEGIEIPKENLKPGKHFVTIRDNVTGNYVEQTFLYGVLALNTNKTVYQTDETAYIQMAALDDNGNTICDANLELIAFSPNGQTHSFKVSDQTITRSETCGANNVTDVPDYFVNLPLNSIGEYSFQITNLSNGFSSHAKVNVNNDPQFSVERTGATRINPYRSTYTMTINFSANSGFSGSLMESVPEDFQILETEEFGVIVEQGQKFLRWEIDSQPEEELQMQYTYQAPRRSPDLYLLGPLTLISDDGQQAFVDTKEWQLASDAQFARPDSDVSTGSWTTTPLWSKIDETTASDTDLVRSPNNPNNSAFEVGLSNVTDPQSTSTHTLRVRERMQESGGGQPSNSSVTITLKQGSTTIASSTYTHGNNDTAWYTREYSLSSTEINNITDYSDLRISVSASKTGGARTNWVEVSWAELETPDPPPNSPPTLNIDQPDGTNDTIAQNANYTVQYDLADSDNVVTANFYYDTNNSGLDGTAISGCANQEEGTNATCTWNTTGVAPGTYYVYGITTDGVNPQVSAYSSGVVTINAAPTINVDQPDGTDDEIAEGVNFTVQYDLADTDNIVNANFYYDTNNSGLDGTAITGCANQAEGSNVTCTWNTTGVSPGMYYVYGTVSDGVNSTVSAYSSGVVTINDTPTINVDQPDGTDDEIAEGVNFTVQYDLADTDNGVTADFYYDTNNTGLDGTAISGCASQAEGMNATCIWNTTGVSPGTYYIYGIVSDGINAAVNTYSSGVVTINAAPQLTIDTPDLDDNRISQDAVFAIRYDLSDSDDTVTTDFYYDSDNSGIDGTAIPECQNQSEGSMQFCDWDTTGVVPGGYFVYGLVNDGVNTQLSVYSMGKVIIDDSPDLTIDQPDGTDDEIAQNANYTVQYDLEDSDDNVTVDFYYDTDNSGLDGTAISGCQDQVEGTDQTCTWNTTDVSAGDYYVYGIADDGFNAQVEIYSSGVLTIKEPPTINIDQPDGTDDEIAQNANYTVQYDLADTDDSVTADFYFDTDNSGLDGTAISGCQDQVEGTDQTCTWNTTGVSPGTYYVYGLVNDGVNSQVDDYSSGVVTINSAPSITVDQPDGTDDTVTEGMSLTVQFDLADTDDTVTADFYYDSDNSGLDGTAIAGCTNEAEGIDATCTWDTTGVTPGNYYVYGVVSDGVNSQVSDYSFGVATITVAGNDAPNISVDQPDGTNDMIEVGDNYTVQYDLDDPDDTVTADFYFDSDNSGLDGTAISGCVDEAEGTDQNCTWDTTGVPAGTYYVYGLVNDGVNPQVSNYSSGVVTINDAPAINIDQPDGTNDTIAQDSNFTIQYDLSDIVDTVVADFYYDTNNSGLDGTAISGCQDRAEGNNATCIWDTTGVSPGTYYVYGVTSDGFNSEQNAYSSGAVTINARPTITVDQPDGTDDMILEDATFTVQYDLTDTDDTVTADFYYDNNTSGLDGAAAVGCSAQSEGNNLTCTWDTSGVQPGTYYIYGVVNDGVNSAVSDYSSGVVTIDDAPDLTIDQPDGVDDEIGEGTNFTVQYDLSDNDDTVTVDFYYDISNSGLDGIAIDGCQNQEEGTNVTCLWDTTSVTPGDYYIYGITSDGNNPQVEVYSSGVVTINDAPTLNVDQPDGTNDTIAQDANFSVQYDLGDTDDEVTANFYYDTNDSGLDGTAIVGCANQSEGNNLTCTWDTTGVLPGNYYVYGIVSDGVNTQVSAYSSGVVIISDPPEITIDQPDGVNDEIAEGANFTVQYDLDDSVHTVTADFYYDTNNTGEDGTAIAGCQNQPEGVDQTCVWDTTGVTPGTYYVYGKSTDGINPEVTEYSSGVVTINDPPTINIDQPDGIDDSVTEGDNFTVQYDLDDTDDTVTADFYYDSNNSGLDGTAITGCQDQAEETNATCTWNTSGVTPGTYYVYGVVNDGVNSQVIGYSSDVITINVAPESHTIILTSGTSWQVPELWDDNNNIIHVIGGGGGGANGSASTPGTGGGGGGGGGYSSVSDVNLTPGTNITFAVGTGGSVGANGGSTYFNGSSCGTSSVCATGGVSGSGTRAGGTASVGTGNTGGTGGAGGATSNGGGGGGGGAGAAGPNAGGNNGVSGSGGSGNTGGGGGSGGQGDGTNGGSAGSAGSSGGGSGGNGGNGTEWEGSHGSGGGAGGGGGANRNAGAGSAGTAGQYGAGGGGGGGNAVGGTGAGSGTAGIQGLIVITYSDSTNLAPSIHLDQPDGVNDKVAESANYTIQYDLTDPDDVVTADFYYDTNNSGLDGTAIAGCQDQAEGTDATCTWNTTGVAPGTYYIYAITDDGEAAQQSDYSDGAVTINSSPAVTNVSLNGGSDIDLTVDSTTNIDFTATVTDVNGYGDISSVTGKAYRSGVTNAENCITNNNNCYQDVSCTLSGCTGNSCTATCTVPIAFFADATDAGTYQSEYWLAWIEATDGNSATDAGFSPSSTTEINSLIAIDAPASLGYSNVSPGGSSSEQTTSIVNTGNRILDLQVSGDDMCSDYPTCAGNTITVDNQEYSLSTFTYGSGTDLTGSLVTLDSNIAKSSVVPSNSTNDIFWRIGIPSLTIPAVYNGSNTVVGIASP